MNPCIFVSVWNMFFFSFLLELNWILQHMDIWAVFFAASSIVKKVFVTTRVKNEQKLGFRVFTSPFNRTLVSQKLFRTEAFSPSCCETDRSLKLWMLRSLPCWRQHLTLHMKTVLFHCFWVTYTFHSIIRCNRNILVRKDESFLSFNKTIVPEKRGGGDRRGKGAMHESVTVLRSLINHPVYTTHYLPGGPLF